MVNGEALWRQMLARGQYPSGEIAAGFFRRPFLAARDWLMGDFLGERPLILTMWRTLLSPLPGRSAPTVGVLPTALTQTPRKTPAPLDELWRQMEWGCLLTEDRERLSPEQEKTAIECFYAAWERAQAWRGEIPKPLWESYSGMARDICCKNV